MLFRSLRPLREAYTHRLFHLHYGVTIQQEPDKLEELLLMDRRDLQAAATADEDNAVISADAESSARTIGW